ncbi:fructose-specific PTS transporter subunit EIIC [Scopulibacillus cellulosilyticus]|uniref:Fructose-specific PTS transporter subunit EIIC n=1 Tax=Scopulibacillus cellulosilyticus TaxID=2665665 RepID=A0ABW2Q1M7_9BACL
MGRKLVAVTNCPAGIAHTYMSAEALQSEAEKRGDTIKVETQGSIGVENELTASEIAQADYVIIAAGRGMSDDEMRRFDGKKVLIVDVSDVLKNVSKVMDRLNENIKVYHNSHEDSDDEEKVTSSGGGKKGVAGVFQHLMNGVSFMIPFVTAGGILLAISAALVGGGKTEPGTFAYLLEQVGSIGFSLMIPILAGYTAYSIADKPALAPAMIGAWLANQPQILGTKGGAGFLGAILVGLLVGYFVKWFKRFKLPKSIAPLMSFLIIPTVATLLISIVVYYAIGPVISGLMLVLTHFLSSIPSSSLAIICAIIGMMIAFDMGGPINKTAYLFALGLIPQGNAFLFGTVALVTVIPPAALGIATMIAPKLFKKEEIANGRSAGIVGLFGITEPAIPYAVNDPIPVISAQLIAAAITGALGAVFHITRIAPGAGILDPIIGIVQPRFVYYIILIIGIAINVALVILFKKMRMKRQSRKV